MTTKKSCACVGQHVPTPHITNDHHILPQSWGGPTVAANLVTLCPTTHFNVHDLLNHYVHAGGEPAWEVRRMYSAFVRDLAQRAWDQRPNDKPPYTAHEEHQW